MNCYSVFNQGKQVRVYAYSILEDGDWKRAQALAFEFADRQHNAGYPCIVELFHMCTVGKTVYTTGE